MGIMNSNWEIRLLLVCDNPILLKLLEKSVHFTEFQGKIRTTASIEGLFKELYIFSPDIVISVRSARSFHSREIVQIVKSFNSYISVFVVASDTNSDAELEKQLSSIDQLFNLFNLNTLETSIEQTVQQKRQMLYR